MKPKFFIPVLCLLTGCASYNARPLNNLCIMQTPNQAGRIVMAAHAFDKRDCKKYLDRDVIGEGYQPIQVQIINNTDRNFLFSPARVSLPLARPEEVADRVHTSTVGRVVGYGTAAVLTCGLFAIPAVVDGIKSAQANESLDDDFYAKSAKDLLIGPHSSVNALLFTHVTNFRPYFSVTLLDSSTNHPEVFNVVASR